MDFENPIGGLDPFSAFDLACDALEVSGMTDDEAADAKVKIGSQIADDTCTEHRVFCCPQCFDVS